jgi:hypothetical protein
MRNPVLTPAEMDECRTMWFRDVRSMTMAKLDAIIQHAAAIGVRKVLADPHAATIEEAVETLNMERYRASELERQYAEAKDAISLEPMTHDDFMNAIRAMRKKNADLQTFLRISDDARAEMMKRMETLAHWKSNAVAQMAELEKEQRHLRSLLMLMQSTMADIESLNDTLTTP